jgi:regulatory protein
MSRASLSPLSPLDYAYRLLARRAHSEQELAEKLLAKGFTAAAVARTTERLLAQGYLNDAQLAADQAERLHKQGFGCERIRAKLFQKGLAPDTIDNALTTEGSSDELGKARRFLASRFSPDALKQPKVAARACRLLVSRGYSQDVVEQLLGSGLDSTWRTEEE